MPQTRLQTLYYSWLWLKGDHLDHLAFTLHSFHIQTYSSVMTHCRASRLMVPEVLSIAPLLHFKANFAVEGQHACFVESPFTLVASYLRDVSARKGLKSDSHILYIFFLDL